MEINYRNEFQKIITFIEDVIKPIDPSFAVD